LDHKGRNKAGIRPTAAGFAIIGSSGQGKTTSIESSLLLYPQVIEHANYKGTPLPLKQLVWLKLNCPFDGSTKGLCMNFFQAADAALGSTRYFKKFVTRGATQDILIPQMAQIASLHGLGVLVVDEIQNLSPKSGINSMMQFFTQVVNTIGVPIILVGTYKAMKLFSGSFSQARRNSGQGDLVMDRLEEKQEWTYFVDRLWKYQWTATPTTLTPVMSKTLYDLSQGIIDIAVKLYMLAQWEVIGNLKDKKEIIKKETLLKVADKHLRFISPMLRALKEGNTSILTKLEDLYPKWDDLDQYLQETKEKLHLRGKVSQSFLRDEKVERDEDVYIELINTALKFGVPSERAEQIVAYIIKRFGTDCGLVELRKQLIPLIDENSPLEDIVNPLDIVEGSPPTIKKMPKLNKKSFIEPGDLRQTTASKGIKSEEIYRNAEHEGALGTSVELFPTPEHSDSEGMRDGA
jgi:hypothetical protein